MLEALLQVRKQTREAMSVVFNGQSAQSPFISEHSPTEAKRRRTPRGGAMPTVHNVNGRSKRDTLLAAINDLPALQQADAEFDAIDVDGDGKITRAEFEASYLRKSRRCRRSSSGGGGAGAGSLEERLIAEGQYIPVPKQVHKPGAPLLWHLCFAMCCVKVCGMLSWSSNCM